MDASTFGDVGTSINKWSFGVLTPAGFILGIPCNDARVLKIDTGLTPMHNCTHHGDTQVVCVSGGGSGGGSGSDGFQDDPLRRPVSREVPRPDVARIVRDVKTPMKDSFAARRGGVAGGPGGGRQRPDARLAGGQARALRLSLIHI